MPVRRSCRDRSRPWAVFVNGPLRGGASSFGLIASHLHEKQPPLPPLSGGQEKTKALLPAAGVAFLYPPDKGGRGGRTAPRRGCPLSPVKEGLSFQGEEANASARKKSRHPAKGRRKAGVAATQSLRSEARPSGAPACMKREVGAARCSPSRLEDSNS